MTRQEIIQQIKIKRSFLCVGLDPDPKKMPQCVFDVYDPIFHFNRAIIDATAPYSIAFKPNLAFYEAYGSNGMKAYMDTINYIRQKHPHHLIIADAKRADIGNTAAMYARTFFQEHDVHALTVAPYMGEDSVTPFMQYTGKWVVLLVLTSNPGSQDFQYIQNAQGEPLFSQVIRKSQQWGATPDNMMYVVGATHPEQLHQIRTIAPKHFLLVPGIGAQGGSLHEVCKYGMTTDGGLIINASRSIIYASGDDHFAEIAGNKARELQQQMSDELRAAGI